MIELYKSPIGSVLTWLKPQIYTGPGNAVGIHDGGVVPKVNDIVVTWIGNGCFQERVTMVDDNNLSTLEPTNPVSADGGPIMIGVDPACAELLTMRNLYLNPTNNKFPVSVDIRIPIHGTELAYAKLFLGTDISKTGNVISVRYNEAGEPIDDRMAVVLQDDSDPDNYIYTIREGNVLRLLKEDTVVTLVVYNSTNGSVRIRTLVVKHNHLTANLNNNANFIKDLELDDPWVDPQNPLRLLIPSTLLESSFSPTIRKVYQNNRTETVPESDMGLSIEGWGKWASSRAGTSFPLVVKYRLKQGERSVVTDPVLGTHISKHYTALIVDRGTGITYHLYVLPEFVDDVVGYRLKAYLYASDYSLRLDVTSDVRFSAFNGKAWKVKQTVTYALELNDVEEVASNRVLSGAVILELVNKPILEATAFKIYTHPGDLTPYGNGLKLNLRPGMNIYNLDISSGFTQYANWLEEMYYKLNPYYDPLTTNTPPVPSHVDIKIGTHLLTFRMDEWEIPKLYPFALPVNGILADVTFYILTANNERLELAGSKLYVEIV